MPPPPELGDRLGDIGVVEVAHELEAQHPAQAHSHVGVAGEVEVELESESGHAQPCPSSGELPGGEGQNGIPQLADVVGQQDLFRQAHHEDLHAGGKLLGGVVRWSIWSPRSLYLMMGPAMSWGKSVTRCRS